MIHKRGRLDYSASQIRATCGALTLKYKETSYAWAKVTCPECVNSRNHLTDKTKLALAIRVLENVANNWTDREVLNSYSTSELVDLIVDDTNKARDVLRKIGARI